MMFHVSTFRAAAAVLALTSVVACSSKKEDAAPAPTAGVSWTVDGGNVAAASAQGQTTSGTLGFSATYVSTSNSGSFSGVTFSNLPKAPGTYDVSGTNSNSLTGAQCFYVSDGGTYAATSGSIVITSVGASSFAGTFSFTARLLNGTPTKTLTNGKFNVTF